MEFITRSLSPQESRVILSLAERGAKETTRRQVIHALGVSPQAADHVIRGLRRKGWLQRASWGRYLLVPPEMGPEAIGDSNVLALASRIVEPYYFGYGTAATHYGFTTQHRQVVQLVTTTRTRNRSVLDTEVRIVNPVQRKFFGFGPVEVLGYTVMMSDREKTVIDCIDRPSLAGGEGETATITAVACRRMDWHRAISYLERMASLALTRRFGWLADHAGAEIPDDARAHLQDLAKGSGRAFLGPRIPRPGSIGYQNNWQLTANVASHELRESAGAARRHRMR
ncbi:MAG: transcriptional regulator [Gammaproteobacteria bacterium]|nr:transcriptional regulator [Gammaproteobacteria bacterium]